MAPQAITGVLLRREGSGHNDRGDLTIAGDSIQFHGQGEPLSIRNVQFVSMGRPSRLAGGNWVKVEYGESHQPSAVYVREPGNAGGVSRIHAALQHFPNSRQFDCRIWAAPSPGRRWFRLTLGSAPRRHWGYTALRKGAIAATRTGTLTLCARGLQTREVDLSTLTGLAREVLTAKRQLLSMGVDTLLTGIVVGLLIAVVGLLQRSGTADPSLAGFLNLFALGLGLGIVPGLVWALPTLPRVRAVVVFTLKHEKGQWEFGVPTQQADGVAQTLESWELENKAP